MGKDMKERTCLLINKSIPTERNTLKILEKLIKYKDLAIEIKKTWGTKTTTVPVIIGAFRLVKKRTENYIGKIPGNIRITELYRRLSSLELLTYLREKYIIITRKVSKVLKFSKLQQHRNFSNLMQVFLKSL